MSRTKTAEDIGLILWSFCTRYIVVLGSEISVTVKRCWRCRKLLAVVALCGEFFRRGIADWTGFGIEGPESLLHHITTVYVPRNNVLSPTLPITGALLFWGFQSDLALVSIVAVEFVDDVKHRT